MTKSLEVPPPAGPSPGAIFEPPVATDTSSTRQAEALAAAAEKETKAKAAKAARRRLDEAEASEPAESVFTGRTLVFAVVIIGVGVGVLIWRYRQRQLELAATTVLSTPLSLPVAPTKSSGAVFTADLLNKLDWKRFEGLVAAYYSKTGVVALRTNTGPESAVHIKISWKGEPRPFAYVRCIAHPSALVDAKPVQDLIAALAAEDIRRGYVVTAGKFNVAARDVAEEKHITLLPGDIFLEKLNDLPASARSEVMQAIDGGD